MDAEGLLKDLQKTKLLLKRTKMQLKQTKFDLSCVQSWVIQTLFKSNSYPTREEIVNIALITRLSTNVVKKKFEALKYNQDISALDSEEADFTFSLNSSHSNEGNDEDGDEDEQHLSFHGMKPELFPSVSKEELFGDEQNCDEDSATAASSNKPAYLKGTLHLLCSRCRTCFEDEKELEGHICESNDIWQKPGHDPEELRVKRLKLLKEARIPSVKLNQEPPEHHYESSDEVNQESTDEMELLKESMSVENLSNELNQENTDEIDLMQENMSMTSHSEVERLKLLKDVRLPNVKSNQGPPEQQCEPSDGMNQEDTGEVELMQQSMNIGILTEGGMMQNLKEKGLPNVKASDNLPVCSYESAYESDQRNTEDNVLLQEKVGKKWQPEDLSPLSNWGWRSYCSQVEEDPEILTNRQTQYDGSDGTQCLKCLQIFNSKFDAVAHVRERHFAPLFKCKLCDNLSRTEILFKRHLNGRHLKPFGFSCFVCDKVLKTELLLNNHMETHGIDTDSERFSCQECNETFLTKGYVDVHLKDVHNITQKPQKPQKPFSCDVCDRSYTKKDTLKKHMMRVHSANAT